MNFVYIMPFIKGLSFGLGLIMSIGLQNTFVLKQGLTANSHIFIIPFLCSLIDALLITLGILGLGKVIILFPNTLIISKYIASIFLFLYGAKSLYSAIKSNDALRIKNSPNQNLSSTIIAILVVSLLNPQNYLETVLLLGSISLHFEGLAKISFGAGAISASFIWFFSLAYGAKMLRPIFSRPFTWKILDLFITFTMWFLAISIILEL